MLIFAYAVPIVLQTPLQGLIQETEKAVSLTSRWESRKFGAYAPNLVVHINQEPMPTLLVDGG